MLQTIPFTIEIKNKIYTGYLQANDSTGEPPKVFFVFIDNYIVGNLLCTDAWKFEQVGERFAKFTSDERKTIADYLGNIAVAYYQ